MNSQPTNAVSINQFKRFLLFVWSIGNLSIEYVAYMSSQPPEGPFPPNQQISLLCNVLPVPQEPVTYKWVSSLSNNIMIIENETSPMAYYQPYYNHTRFGRVFCSAVSSDDGRTLAIASIVIEVQGMCNIE